MPIAGRRKGLKGSGLDAVPFRTSAARREILESYFEGARDLFQEVSSAGRFLTVNRAWRETLGYGEAEVGMLTIDDVVHPDSRERWREAVARSLASGGSHAVEALFRSRDGRSVAVEGAVDRFSPLGTKRAGTRGIFRDVTPLRRGHDRLLAQLAVTGILAERPPLPAALASVAEALCRHLGFSVGLVWRVDPEDGRLRCGETWSAPGIAPDLVEESRAMAVEKGRGLPGRVWAHNRPMWIEDAIEDPEFRRSRSAERVGLHTALCLPISADSDFSGVIELFHRDVAPPDVDLLQLLETTGRQVGLFVERQRTEDALRRSEEHLRNRAEVLELLAGGRPLSEVLSRLVHAIEARAPGLRASILLREGDVLRRGAAPSLPESYLRAVEGTAIASGAGPCGTAAFENRTVIVADVATDPLCRDRREFAGSHGLRACFAQPIVSASHEVLGTVAGYYAEPRRPSAEDVRLIADSAALATVAIERKAKEEAERRLLAEVRQQAVELERRVAERTVRLEALNRELKGFAYTVSHDLKAPLRGIVGYAQELQRKHDEGLSDRARFCHAQIVRAARNLDRLIEDLLEYSRLDAQTSEWHDVDLAQVVEGILGDRARLIAERSVEVSVVLNARIVHGWRRGLVQALSNLIDNALKYARHATPPRLSIVAEEVGAVTRIAVRDNGIGFEPKHRDRIFGLFSRLPQPAEYEGTGAGLAIVRKAIEKQGGTVRAESTPGGGATFVVEVPLRPTDGGRP